jgi:hypothetical protein
LRIRDVQVVETMITELSLRYWLLSEWKKSMSESYFVVYSSHERGRSDVRVRQHALGLVRIAKTARDERVVLERERVSNQAAKSPEPCRSRWTARISSVNGMISPIFFATSVIGANDTPVLVYCAPSFTRGGCAGREVTFVHRSVSFSIGTMRTMFESANGVHVREVDEDLGRERVSGRVVPPSARH